MSPSPRPLTLAARCGQVLPSATLAMTARAQALVAAGQDVLSMTAGEPDFPTPQAICAAAQAAMDGGQTRYTAVAGTAQLRAAVLAAHRRQHGLDAQLSEVIVGTGGKQVLFNAMAALVGPGDEVLLPWPYWVSYPDMVRFFGGTPIFVRPQDDHSPLPLASDWQRHLTANSKLLLLNSPSNPVGAAYSAAQLDDIAALLRQHPTLWAVSDDIYAGLTYDGPFVGIAGRAKDLAERLLVVGGVSKSYAMTGWRIGYGVGPAPLIAAMSNIQGASTSGACSIAQAAATEALAGDQAAADAMRLAFAGRRDRIVAALGQIEGMALARPTGAFYAWVDVAAHLGGRCADAHALCEWLLEKEGLATVPGSAFGSDRHLRLSFACSDAHIDEGVRRLGAGLGRLGR